MLTARHASYCAVDRYAHLEGMRAVKQNPGSPPLYKESPAFSPLLHPVLENNENKVCWNKTTALEKRKKKV